MKLTYHVIYYMPSGTALASTKVVCAAAEITADAVRFTNADGTLAGYFPLSRILGFSLIPTVPDAD